MSTKGSAMVKITFVHVSPSEHHSVLHQEASAMLLNHSTLTFGCSRMLAPLPIELYWTKLCIKFCYTGIQYCFVTPIKFKI